MAIASLSTKNPFYIQRELDWTMMRDAYGGERYIKEKGQEYLPATSAMIMDGMAFKQQGWNAYNAYRARAVYHELVKPALMAGLGVMHRKPPVIKLPKKLEPMRLNATFNGEGLEALLQKINEQQMLMGRHGLMLDVANNAPPTAMPYIIGYNAEAIVNWDSTKQGDDKGQRALQLVVLNETAFERTSGFAWSQRMRYRVLARAGDVRDLWDVGGPDETYIAAEVKNTQDASLGDFRAPELAGRTLKSIPFVFVGPRDLVPEPDLPALLPLARLALAIYRTEADYRQSGFMQGQDTLVVVGQQADANAGKQRVGAFGSIDLPMGGDAFYIGATSDGMSDLAEMIDNDEKRAAQLGAQLLTERGNEAEAGEALNIRVASRTATLTTIAKVGATAMEKILKAAAEWVGANPDEVSVTPNLDFADNKAQSQDAVYLMTAKNMGFPISRKSVHGWAARNEFTEMDYEDEEKELAKEPVSGLGMGTPGMAGVAGSGMDVLPGPGKQRAGAKPGATKETSGDAPPGGGAKPTAR